jgi:hypothetical protein
LGLAEKASFREYPFPSPTVPTFHIIRNSRNFGQVGSYLKTGFKIIGVALSKIPVMARIYRMAAHVRASNEAPSFIPLLGNIMVIAA